MRTSVVATLGPPPAPVAVPKKSSTDAILEGSNVRLIGRCAERLDELLLDAISEERITFGASWTAPEWGTSTLERVSGPSSDGVHRQRLLRRRRWRERPVYELTLPDGAGGMVRGGDELTFRRADGGVVIHARCGSAVLVRHLLSRFDAHIRDRIRAGLDDGLLRTAPSPADFRRASDWGEALIRTLHILDAALVGRYAPLALDRELAHRQIGLVIQERDRDTQRRVGPDRYEELDDVATSFDALRENITRMFGLQGRANELAKLQLLVASSPSEPRRR